MDALTGLCRDGRSIMRLPERGRMGRDDSAVSSVARSIWHVRKVLDVKFVSFSTESSFVKKARNLNLPVWGRQQRYRDTPEGCVLLPYNHRYGVSADISARNGRCAFMKAQQIQWEL